MTTDAVRRLVGFAAVVALVFAAALIVGRWVGPVEIEKAAAHDAEHDADEAGHGDEHSGHSAEPAAATGLSLAEGGYRLDLETPTAAPGTRTLAFSVIGPDGEPVTTYDVQHDKQLHLIVVRRDLTGFQHLHPVLTDGTWRVPADLTPGQWRVIADFKPTSADPLVLGADLTVPGALRPTDLGPDTRSARVGPYSVDLTGDLEVGEPTTLTVNVGRRGQPVTDLEDYLGAKGHLVALREGDLGYLHVHPETGPGPQVEFATTFPSAGAYRLFFDFQHAGLVRNAAFTVHVGEGHHEH